MSSPSDTGADLLALKHQIESTGHRLDDLGQHVDQGLADVLHRVDDARAEASTSAAHVSLQVNQRLDELGARMDQGFAAASQRLDDMAERADQRTSDHIHHTDLAFSAVNRRFDDLTARMDRGFAQTRSFQWGLLVGLVLLVLKAWVHL